MVVMKLTNNKRLSPQDRKNKILKSLNNKEVVKIQELSSALNVTRETVRKDLYELEQEGNVTMVYGGAILNHQKNETAYSKRMKDHQLEKRRIAQFAASLINDGDTIYLDYGTTTFMLSEELKKRKGITVVTNTLPIVNQLLHNVDINLIIPGGVIRNNEDSLFGSLAINNMNRLYVDIGFFGIAGISKEGGLTNFHMGENDVSRLMLLHSKKKIILADHSKFGNSALYKTADFNEADLIITDRQPDKEIEDTIINEGCQIEKMINMGEDHQYG